MKVRLEKIRFEPFAWQETLSPAAGDLDRPELVGISPVACEGRLVPAEPGLLLSVRLVYAQEIACDRCLAPFSLAMAETIEALVLAGREPEEGGEVRMDESEAGVVRVFGDVLDTDPLVLEQIQLAIPAHPLCRPDCAGLCPRCGADLNQEPCRCEARPTDPRWEVLAALRLPPGGGERE